MLTEDELLAPDPATAVLADACHLRIPSQPDWINPTVEYLVHRAVRCGAVAADRETKLTIALHEALTNAIIHGNLGISSDLKESGDDAFLRAVAARLTDPVHATRVVDVRASYDGQVARWVMHDQGSGFDAHAALRRLDEVEPDLCRLSGRGLLMMRAFTDELRYEDGGRRLELSIYRQSERERRSQPRVPTNALVQLTPLDEQGQPAGAERGAISRNVSTDGLAFVASGDVPAGRVLLRIPAASGERPVEVMAEIRRWQPMGGNVIEVGCRFETPLDWPNHTSEVQPDELARLVERLSGGTARPDERRRAPRLPFAGRVEVLLSSGEVRNGYGRDLSRGGIAFLCSGEVPLEVVQLRLAVGEGEAITVRAQVLRATKLIEGFYDVGARFVLG